MNRNFKPPRPVGEGTFIRFCQAVWDRVFGAEGQFISSTTVQVEQTTRGIILHAAPPGGKKQKPADPGIGTQVELVSVAGDTLIVQKVDDDDNITSTLLVIAKPYELRQSLTSELIDNVTVDYVYDNAWTRQAVIAGVFIETQIIIPRYTVGQQLQYIICDNTGIPGIKAMDVNVAGRAWARKYV